MRQAFSTENINFGVHRASLQIGVIVTEHFGFTQARARVELFLDPLTQKNSGQIYDNKRHADKKCPCADTIVFHFDLHLVSLPT